VGERTLEPDGYGEMLATLKARVRATQVRASRAANTEVLRLYWSIGHDILERQQTAGWGAKVVTRLAADLRREFPDQRGWSRSNLLNMRRVAEVWTARSRSDPSTSARRSERGCSRTLRSIEPIVLTRSAHLNPNALAFLHGARRKCTIGFVVTIALIGAGSASQL